MNILGIACVLGGRMEKPSLIQIVLYEYVCLDDDPLQLVHTCYEMMHLLIHLIDFEVLVYVGVMQILA